MNNLFILTLICSGIIILPTFLHGFPSIIHSKSKGSKSKPTTLWESSDGDNQNGGNLFVVPDPTIGMGNGNQKENIVEVDKDIGQANKENKNVGNVDNVLKDEESKPNGNEILNSGKGEYVFPIRPTESDEELLDRVNTSHFIRMSKLQGRSISNKRISPKVCSTKFKNKVNGSQTGRSAVAGNRYRWIKGFYTHFDPKFDEDERKLLYSVLADLGDILCIEVKYWNDSNSPARGDFVYITHEEEGCWSDFVGKQGGKQTLNIGLGCWRKDLITHELIHTLGFYHEQNRPDRDQFVNIFWKNITLDWKEQFLIEKESLTLGIPYDVFSIMHYASWYCSVGPGFASMLTKSGEFIEETTAISPTDIQKLKKISNCPNT